MSESALNGRWNSASTLVVEILGQEMTSWGMADDRANTEKSITRPPRDAYGAALLVHDDRISRASAQKLLAHEGD